MPIIAQIDKTGLSSEMSLLISTAKDDMANESGALILLKDYRMSVNRKNQTELQVRVVGKVYTRDAVSDYSEIPILFNSYYEEPQFGYARVINKEGKVTQVMKDAIQFKTLPESQGLNYTDNRYLSFALPGLEPGSVFDYQITFVRKIPIIEGEWFDNHWFSGLLLSLSPPYQPRFDPTQKSRYTLVVPKGSEFNCHLTSVRKNPIKTTDKDQDIYIWELSDLPGIKLENKMPPLDSINPELKLSSVKEWSQIDKWLSAKFNLNTEPNDEVRSRAAGLTASARSTEEKIKILYNFIQNEIRYIYSDLDRGGFTPHSPSDILNSRYGDCKDKTILFLMMLKSVGIEAYPALLTPYPEEEGTEIPNPGFSHMIAFIPYNDKKDIWLDLTSEVTPFPELFFTDQGRTALIIDGKGGRITKTPSSEATENNADFSLSSHFEGNTAIIMIQISTKGVLSDLLKMVIKQADKNNREEIFKQLISRYIDKAEFDTLAITDPSDPQRPFSVTIKYHIKEIWNKDLNNIRLGSHSLIPLSLLSTASEWESAPSKRYNDIIWPLANKIQGTEEFELPDKNLLPIEIPQKDSLSNGYITFNQTFKCNGNSLLCKWSLVSEKYKLPKEKYSGHLEFLKSIKEKLLWKIDYAEPFNYILQSIRNDSPNNVIKSCNLKLSKDSSNIMARLMSGIAYHNLKQEELSIKAFKEVLKRDPENKYARLWIAGPLMSSKNFSAILVNLGEAIKIDPYFTQAYLTRASTYMTMNQPDNAVFDFEKAYLLDPGNSFVLQTIGFLLDKTGKSKEALDFYLRAVRVDTTNAVLYSEIAMQYVNLKEYQKSVDLYKKALNLDPSNASYTGNLGWSYYLLNDDNRCIDFSQKAIKIDSTAYFARYNLGLAYLRSGEIDKARQIYNDLKKIRNKITYSEKDGAIRDLLDLKAKGIFVQETKAILKEFFDYQ